MKEYRPVDTEEFSGKIDVIEKTDPTYCEVVNKAPKQLITNDVYLYNQMQKKANLTDVSSPYQFKGSCLSANLPGSGNKINDTYYVTDKKCKFTWNGAAWYQSSLNESEYEEELGSLKEDINNLVSLEKMVSENWEQGTFSGGVVSESGRNIRTKTYVDTSKYYGAEASTGYIVRLVEFDSDGTFISMGNAAKKINFDTSNGHKYRVVLASEGYTKTIDITYCGYCKFLTDKYVSSEQVNKVIYEKEKKLEELIEKKTVIEKHIFQNGRYSNDGNYTLTDGWANISNTTKIELKKGIQLKIVNQPAFVTAYLLKKLNTDGTFTQIGGAFTDTEIIEDGTYTICCFTSLTRQLMTSELEQISDAFNIVAVGTNLRADVDANKKEIETIRANVKSITNIEIHIDDFTESGLTDTQIIKNCLQFTSNYKYRTIVFDRRNFNIDESIMLPSNTTVIIDGVTIKQNDYVFDTMFRSDNMTMEDNYPHGLATAMTECENIKIIGKNGATISGCDNVNNAIITDLSKDWGTWGWKGILILITNCNGVEIGNLNIEKPHMWSISFEICTNGYVHDIHFDTTEINMDGVDLRYGCKNFVIDNITGKTYDDSVALTCSIRKNLTNDMYPLNSNAVYPGQITNGLIDKMSEDELAIEEIQVKNVLTGGSCRNAICYSNYGGIISNCVFDTLEDAENVENRVAIFKIYGGDNYVAKSIKNIRVNNIKSNNVYKPVQILVDVDDVWINKITKSSYMVNEIKDSDGVTVTNVNS